MVRNYSGIVQEEVPQFMGEHHPILRPTTLSPLGPDEIILKAGTVLGKVTATGKYVPLKLGASDGSEDAVRVLAESINVGGIEDILASGYVHGEFYESGLTWPDGITANAKQTAIDALEAKGIYVV